MVYQAASVESAVREYAVMKRFAWKIAMRNSRGQHRVLLCSYLKARLEQWGQDYHSGEATPMPIVAQELGARRDRGPRFLSQPRQVTCRQVYA